MSTTTEGTFTPVSDLVAAAEAFFRAVAEICQSHGQGWESERDRMFLQHARSATGMLVDDLRKQRSDQDNSALETWQQYRPNRPVPARDELEGLSSRAAGVDAFLADLQASAERWEALCRALAEQARTDGAGEYYESCAALIERYRTGLNSAYQRAQDM